MFFNTGVGNSIKEKVATLANRMGISLFSETEELNANSAIDGYKKTSELNSTDIFDEYQKNYQEATLDDGSYLTKSAEWTDKENGEALITIKGASNQELENTSALYVATLCYAHGLTEDILVRNIEILTKYYDKVDFIAINNHKEAGVADCVTFTSASTEDEIRTYISETKNAGFGYPHFVYSIPYAVQNYLFGNAGDEYISEGNLINDPTAIYVSTDSLLIAEQYTWAWDPNSNEGWGVEYGTQKYFDFMSEYYGNRYFSMSQYSSQDELPCLGVRYPDNKYDAERLNVLIGILNPENYGEADNVFSSETIQKWNDTWGSDAVYFPIQDKKYAADYSYDKDFEEAGVQIITNLTVEDTVQDYFEITDVTALSNSSTIQSRVDGQKVTVTDPNYICGDEVTIQIKVKLKQNMISNLDGFEDTNVGNAWLSCNLNELFVESPKLAINEYKKTTELTDEDKDDEYQKNYQETVADDGSYLIKTAEWTDKENGEALITLKGAQYEELENTSALYVATMCYQHRLTEDILVKNITTLTKYYDKVDFIALNGSGESGITNVHTFYPDSTEEEIRTYIRETKEAGITFPHAINSIPPAIEKYLFGNMGDEYISEENLINNPTAIYVSTDSFYLAEGEFYGLDGLWGIDYATEKYFNFIEENYGDRYFSMSQYSQQDDNPQLTVRYLTSSTYDSNIMNIMIGILNPENYGEADLVLSEESLKTWEEKKNTTTSYNTALNLPYTDKKYAADYSYDKDFEEAGVQIITNCTIADTVQDYYEILDAQVTGGSDSKQLVVNGQNVLFYDENYVCGDEVTIQIKVKLRQDSIEYFEGFEDTNLGKAVLNGNETIDVDSPELAPTTASYTVNYLDKKTGEQIHTSKTDTNIPINTIINSSNEVIDIEKYNYDSADKETLVLGTGKNVINLYYNLKDAIVTDNIEKTGTEKITSKDENVSYTIKYHANVDDYYGDARVTIVDELPYKIDVQKSNLDGGSYDEEAQTITWVETIEDIDTYTNGARDIDISKNITVVYTNLDVTKSSFDNKAQGTIWFEELDKQEDTEEVTVTTTTEFKVDVTVTKTWDHTNNIYTIPDSIILQVKNGDKVVRTQTITNANATSGNPNVWSYTFTGLDKYDEAGNEITYTAGEAEVTAGNLNYYKATVDGTNITNTYNGPVISQSKSVSTENGLSYVVEGEKITYTVTVKNEGGVAKDVVVSDTIPEGTTFVSNSVKVDNSGTSYTESNLNNGITVNVGANSETKVTFEVTVNVLPNGTYLKELKNTAIVDGKPTNETTTVVNKSNLTFEKTSNPVSGSQVKKDDEITYTISLNNSGTIEVDAVVKDNVPEGTSFVEGSIKVNDENTSYDESDLVSGIRVPVEVSGKVTVSFKVKVGDLEDGAEIKNVATVNEVSTNEVTHKYTEPIISSSKTQTTENGLDYVVPGEKIKYTITVRNDGSLAKNVTVQDTAPEGTRFVENSIKVNDEDTEYTENDLNSGITVNLGISSSATISFEVTVEYSNNDFTITNVATVDDEETNETETPYKRPDPGIESSIRKDGTEKITEETQEVQYTIGYTATIEKYVGNATVTIVDELPYDINTEKSNLDGGTYDERNKTITWVESISDIDTYTNGTRSINISKNITVVYKNMDYSKTTFENKAQATILLDEIKEQEDTEEVTVTTETEFKEDVEITKTWDHTNNIYAIPTSVVLQVKNGNQVVDSYTVTEAEGWKHTFTGLDKYDSNGKKIIYTAGEAEVNDGDLDYYTLAVNGTNITNTYNGPVISQSKSFTTENGLSYVVEGEKITYTITVKNSGGVAKDVIVQDSIPEGTSFVEGSIKINNTESGYSESDLNSGITVNVDKTSQTTVSFEVTVNTLPDGTYLKELSNTAIVDGKPTNETTVVVNKSNLTFEKTSNPANGAQVKKGDEITYTISLNNSGTIEVDAVVKDSVPEGTTFVSNSIKINDGDTSYDESDLVSGIRVPVGASEKITVSFKVTVNDLEDGAEIKNVATVNDTRTNEITHEYIEAEIISLKSQYTENNLDYVVPGEKITYLIIAKNSGGLDKNIIVKDNIPEGTTFVEGSIKVNTLSTYQERDLTIYTAEDLEKGIELNIPAGSATSEGFVRLSFDVIVNEDATGEIRNIGTVDGQDTNEVTKPVLTTEKVSSVIRNDEASTLAENEVAPNDEIKYIVRVTNTGTTGVSNIEVKDNVPSGTKLVSINNGGVQEGSEITWSIPTIAEGETKEVSFIVKVEYAKDNFSIINVATVDGKETNETENPYEKPAPEVSSTVAKNGTDKVVSKDQVVNYEVKFTASVDDFKGKAKVTIVDTLPYAIDISQSKLDNGTYNSENNTITWEEEIDVDTFEADTPKDIVITKSIEIVYLYGDINEVAGSMKNTVNSKIELIEDDTSVTTDEKEAEKETSIAIPAEVIVHHYIYDVETDTYTTIKLAPDETIDGIIGQSYTTSKSSQVPSDYSCVDEQPENYSGKMTEETINVNYYYSLITPTVTNTMDKSASIYRVLPKSQTDKEKVPVLEEENEEVIYNIKYTAKIDNYIGSATVTIVDTLPSEIDLDKSYLDNGVYNSTNKTITWEETIDNIDTYTNGTYNYDFERTISLVYTGQNMAEDLINTVVGTINVYYPEEHSSKPGESQLTETAKDTATVKQDYKETLTVEKVWDDNDNQKGHRPDGIIVTISGGDLDNVQVELNEANDWSYELYGLDKYDEKGNEITYSVAESEKNLGDLQYYSARLTELSTDDPSVKSFRFTNTYKLTKADLDASITKTGPEEVTASAEPVNYEINFTSTIKEYIGDGKVIITDTLPYRIDTTNSSLDGGTYDDEAKTITWEEDLNNIDTFVNGDYSINITKNISVVFIDLDGSGNSFTNNILGKVRLYETEQEDQATDSTNTLININGDVIVKYIDIDTGEEISDSITLSGKVGDEYTTSKKEIETYDFINSTPNTEGLITEESQEVTYYYQRKAAQVIAKYQDIDGNELTEDVILDGKVGDIYTTEQKEFENYEFVSVTENATGTMTEDTITVVYVYQKIPATVIVKYLEKGTDKQLALDDEITGFAGDEYTTDRKAIKNYQSSEPEPENKSGTMTKDVITVIYYYERIPAGDIIVKYVDIDTAEEITYIDQETGENKTYGYTITGFVGDNYETELKDISYYNFVRSTSNTTGQLTEAGDTVIYYYQKQSFNLSISKSIEEITLDGSSKGVGDGKTSKVEIHRKKIDSANLEVKYKIVLSNTGEIPGTANVVDVIPSGYTVSNSNPTYWTNSNGSIETQVELQPGETKELEVVLKWVNGESNFGTSENIARITDINNPANYAETTSEDNEDTATIVTSVETGINRNVYLIITTYLLMIGLVVLLYLYEQYQKERKGEMSSRKTLKLKLPNDKK